MQGFDHQNFMNDFRCGFAQDVCAHDSSVTIAQQLGQSNIISID